MAIISGNRKDQLKYARNMLILVWRIPNCWIFSLVKALWRKAWCWNERKKVVSNFDIVLKHQVVCVCVGGGKCKVIPLGKASSCSGRGKIYCDVLVKLIMNRIFAATLCLVSDEIILSLVSWWEDCYVALMVPTDLDLISHLMSFNETWIGSIRLLSLATSAGGGSVHPGKGGKY